MLCAERTTAVPLVRHLCDGHVRAGGSLRKLALLLLLALPLAADPGPSSQEQPILAHLNQAIGWYRRLAAQARLATEPSDVIFIDHDVQLARQAVAQAFDGARALAALDSAPAAAPNASSTLAKRAADAADAAQRTQAEVNDLERHVAAAPPSRRARLAQQLEETKSELAFAQARAQALRTISDFSAQVGAGSAGLLGQIGELERSVPEVRAQSAPPVAPSAAAANTARRNDQGVIALIEELFATSRKGREIRDSLALTAQLR